MAARRSNDVHYTLDALRAQAGPLLRYWWHSAPSRHRSISSAYASLIRRATAEHGDLIGEAGAEALVRSGGFRILHRTQAAMEDAIREAERLKASYDVPFAALSATELRVAEPSLKVTGAGAIHWTEPMSASDPGGLVEAYASLFRRCGGEIRVANAATLRRAGNGWSVQTTDGAIKAEEIVVALGPWSPDLLRPLGYRIPMIRKRGYHRHWSSPQPLRLPLLDGANGYVLAPMAKGLRITTGAELTKFDAPATPVQLRRAEEAAAELLDLGAPVEAEPWFGTRPCMPDMLPAIGPAPRHKGLWFNFGHGHQGFTLGPASGRLLAELMSGEKPFVAAEPFSPRRLPA
ncbi:D-amino-acid dehydrogenase [Faunimonas pinastri]|uniref:D-amino-acid dehydrogenase n=1 Tax=Faunimonas pinastri TaxID=1855383 RepID=A0A1H9K449_9HYPH|nr:D-amino-acid dehydrogenase [Faunimonas pinastri]